MGSDSDGGTADSVIAVAWTDWRLSTSVRVERPPNNWMNNGAVYSIKRTVHSIQRTVYSVSIQYTVYSTQCTILKKLLNNGERNSPFSTV